MKRTLVVGYGNSDRADDGVAFYVVNALRQRLGHGALDRTTTGLEDLGGQTDSIFLLQLTPELIEILEDYDQVIFVDAHVSEDVPSLRCMPVAPAYTSSAFTHHMTPEMLLALLEALHQRNPAAHIVSVRGHEFDFRRGLSPTTEALVDPAVEQLMSLMTDA